MDSRSHSMSLRKHAASDDVSHTTSEGVAYCLVKSCPSATHSYEQLVNAVGFVDFGRPHTVIILPHLRPFSSITPIPVIEELRSILKSEATLLDAETQSVWRIQLDPLTVLNTLSRLGFQASQFHVSPGDGVHTWALSSTGENGENRNHYTENTQSKRCVDAVKFPTKDTVRDSHYNNFSNGRVKTRGKYRKKSSWKYELRQHGISKRTSVDNSVRKETSPGKGDTVLPPASSNSSPSGVLENSLDNDDGDDTHTDTRAARRDADRHPKRTSSAASSSSHMQSQNVASEHDHKNGPVTRKRSRQETVSQATEQSTVSNEAASMRVYGIESTLPAITLNDFMCEGAIPAETLAIYHVPSDASTRTQTMRLTCVCKTVIDGVRVKTCKTNDMVAGRRYCRKAVDEVFHSMQKDGNFSMSRLARNLLNMLYRYTELCCMTFDNNENFVQVPRSHLDDVQRVLVDYWNAYVATSTEPLTSPFVDKHRPSLTNVKATFGKLITDSRSKVKRKVS